MPSAFNSRTLAASIEAGRQLRAALHDNHAVIITGASGTGKTTASLVLLDELRAEVPGLTVVPVTQGPQQVRTDQHPSRWAAPNSTRYPVGGASEHG